MIIMKNKTTIRFYSGLDTIGGVIMELSYNNARVFFEAGTGFDPAFDIFDGSVNIRNKSISDYLWINEIPKIDGIYRKQDITDYPDIISADDYKIDDQAFFITHMHLDHMRMMGLVSDKVKVYLTKPAQILEKALEDVGLGIETIRGLKYEDMPEEIRIGEIYVRRFIINDDSYQDLSFYIETPDLKLHYTGDVFVYGKYEENIIKETDFLRKRKVDILVCEGTRFFSNIDINKKIEPSFKPINGLITKDQLDSNIIDTINAYDGLVFFNYYDREMSDVMLIDMVEENTKRTMVYEPESAHLINEFFNKKVHITIPDTYESKPSYLDEIVKNNTVVTKEEIMNNPEKYIVQNSYPNILELLDYRNIKSMYMRHSGTPLGEFDPKYKNMMKIVEKANMEYVETYHTKDGYFSPHAEHYQILAYIDMVNPKLLIPCHTLNRKALIANTNYPSYYVNKNEVYVYNHESNTLEVIENV